MKLVGRFLLVGSVVEGLVLLGATAIALSVHRGGLLAYAILIPIGLAASSGTAAIGRWLLRRGDQSDGRRSAPPQATQPEPGRRALWARGTAIASVVLIWPLGVVLGPLSLWLSMSERRTLKRPDDRTYDSRPAKQGAVMGALVCGGYFFWLFGTAAAILAFGSPVPAAA